METIQNNINIEEDERTQNSQDGPVSRVSFDNVTKTTKFKHSIRQLDESYKFALRITTSAFLASLFILVPAPEHQFPEGVWILITAVVVSWQASPDIASVSKKMIERLLGTVLGACVGLLLGGVSLLFLEHGSRGHSMYLLACLLVGTFLCAYSACNTGHRGHYSAVLGCATFGIILLSFYEDTDEAGDLWRTGVFRMINICIGGLLAGLSSLCVFPLSTKTLIEQKVTELIVETGKTSHAVMVAATMPPPPLHALARKEEKEDESHKLYMKCLEGWKNTRQLFSLLPYDPIFARLSDSEQKLFWETWRLRLGRVLRIQATLVMLDGLNRSRLHSVQEHDLVARVGDRIRKLYEDSLDSDRKEDIANSLIHEDIPAVRNLQSQLRKEMSGLHPEEAKTPLHMDAEETEGLILEGYDLSLALGVFDDIEFAPIKSRIFHPSQSSLFFYQLLEFLIIRVVRLERFCHRTDAELAKKGA